LGLSGYNIYLVFDRFNNINMTEYIDKLKKIETLVELSIGTTMTEETATDIYAVTNDLMCTVGKLNIPAVMFSLRECKERWAFNYDKTWEDVQRDFEYGIGVSKLYGFEQVMNMVAELYRRQ
jgi:hypothetical protein